MGQGNSQQVQYSVAVTEPKAGETGIYRSPDFKSALVTMPEPGIDTYQKLLLRSFEKFASVGLLGHRAVQADGTHAPEFTWETYS